MSSGRVQKNNSTKANWLETSFNGGALLLSIVSDAAGLTPVPYLKQAAGLTLRIIEAVQLLKDNKAGFQRLADDATGLISTIFDRYKNSQDQASWPPPKIAEIIYELLGTLTQILHFVEKEGRKKRIIRFTNGKADVGKMKEYREKLQGAVEKFKVSSDLIMHESVEHLMKLISPQEQPISSHPTAYEEASEMQAKIEADRRKKEEMEAKAAEERRQMEIEAKQREVAESFASIRRAEAEPQENQMAHDEVQRAQQHEELRQLEAEEQAKKESAGQPWSSTTPIRTGTNSSGLGSTNADDPAVLDEAYKRYEAKVQSHLSKPETGRKGSHSNKSKVEDYEEEGLDEPVIDNSSDEYSTDEEERERRRRRRDEKRKRAKKTASKKTEPTGPTASSVSPSSSSISMPQVRHQSPPPVSPPPPPVEELLSSYFAGLGLNPATRQPYPPSPSQSSQFSYAAGHAPPQPWQHYSTPAPGPYPHAPYYHSPPMGSHNASPCLYPTTGQPHSPPPATPPIGSPSPSPSGLNHSTVTIGSHNVVGNTFSNVGNNNSKTIIRKSRRSTRGT
ncbi:hypothetical protein CPC08DRAFT_824593 [Agrocybe pediades]|nr:hypothetical protein CPC08DRAFT_824593 [Agrocybe pediades]